MDSLERTFLRPRQVRYQAALRPDINTTPDSKALSNSITTRSAAGRVAQAFALSRPVPELWVPHPCVFARVGGDAACAI